MTVNPRLHRIVPAQPYPLLFATISGAHLYSVKGGRHVVAADVRRLISFRDFQSEPRYLGCYRMGGRIMLLASGCFA
jgi:hypothetical protein